MSDESAICAEYLYNKLNVSAVTNALGTASRIFESVVPQIPITGQTLLFPAVVYQQQSSSDTFGVGAVRIFVRPTFTVKVIVDNTGFKAASAIFSIVDKTIQNTSGTATNGSIYSCYRDGQSIRYVEAKPAGGYFYHVGSMYKMEVRATVTP